jgi:hypothetical protein
MNRRHSLWRLAAVAVIGLIAATGCSSSKTAAPPPARSTSTAPASPAVGQPVDVSGLDQGLTQIDEQVSGANAGLASTSEGDVQTQ